MTVTVRPYQQRIIDEVRQKIAQGKRKILVVLPTGGGKSVVAARIMQLASDKGTESIFFAAQRELVMQIGNQLGRIEVPYKTIMAGVDNEYDSYESYSQAKCSLVARDTLWQRAFKRNKMELPPAQIMQIDECVTGDAIIKTERGPVCLKDIIVGDYVLSRDRTGFRWSKVTATFDQGVRNTIVVTTSKGSIRCTPNHQIMASCGIEVESWKEARTLKPGDFVRVEWDYGLEMDHVTSVTVDMPERVYDITVEGTHCFYANGILVHNCHQAGCPTYTKIMEAYDKSIVIGWTATPCRSDNKPLGDWFDSMVLGASYKELQEGGFLVPVRAVAPDRPDLKGCKVSRGDYVQKDLQQRMNRDEMVGNIVKEWLKHGQGRATVLFAAGIDHSVHCRDLFRKEGITAEHIDGKMPSSQRDDIMGRVKDGKVNVLCNYGVATTGVDIPQWKVMICARPTKSFGLWRQMGGRIQRPSTGHDHCLIIDHSDNCLHFGFPDEDVDWDIEGDGDQAKKHMEKKAREKREKGEKSNDPFACEKCKTLYRGYSCPRCGHKPERRGEEIKMTQGQLRELERKKDNRKSTPMEKQKHWDSCLGLAIAKGLKVGAAAHMYKQRFGVFPRGLENMPVASQWQMPAKSFYVKVVKPKKDAAKSGYKQQASAHSSPW